MAACPLCEEAGGALVSEGRKFRLVRASETGFPAFYRLIWNEHRSEFSELTASDRHLCMEAVAQVERQLIEHLQPQKVNLASFGNLVPHLHWHIVARFAWDSHFPAPIWAEASREAPAGQLQTLQQRLPMLDAELAVVLAALDVR